MILALLIDAMIAFLGIIVADKIIAHKIEAKRALILAFIAYFAVPVAVFLISPIITSLGVPEIVNMIFFAYMLPLIIWIVLSELIIDAGIKEKLIIAGIAFAIYTVLTVSGVVYMILSSVAGI
ncbi:MAG: hypothetical protein J4473_03740 [Candidatus Aenigmarchaeota archaeon]|nr:hypothetical protein [Candidatus Aenigmarchaeota archaeon]